MPNNNIPKSAETICRVSAFFLLFPYTLLHYSRLIVPADTSDKLRPLDYKTSQTYSQTFADIFTKLFSCLENILSRHENILSRLENRLWNKQNKFYKYLNVSFWVIQRSFWSVSTTQWRRILCYATGCLPLAIG